MRIFSSSFGEYVTAGTSWEITKGKHDLSGERLKARERLRACLRLSARGFNEARVELMFRGNPGGGFAVELGTYNASLANGGGRVGTLQRDVHLLDEADLPRLDPASGSRVALQVAGGKVSLSVDGRITLQAGVATADRIHQAVIWLPPGGEAWDVSVAVGQECPPLPSRSHDKPFEFVMAVDLPDDLYCTAFTPAMFDAMMSNLAGWGFKRVDWVTYPRDYVLRGANNWAPELLAKFDRTLEAVGDTLAQAVKSAHAAGLEIYSVVKPYDCGWQHLIARRPGDGTEDGSIGRIGEPRFKAWMDYVDAHPEIRLERNMARIDLAAAQRSVKEIRFFHYDDSPTGVAPKDLSLWVSEDNVTYRPYEGRCEVLERLVDRDVPRYTIHGNEPTGRVKRVRELSLMGLHVREPFFAVACAATGGTFVNKRFALTEIVNDQGEAIAFTYGLLRRSIYELPYKPEDFRTHGLIFDFLHDTPSGILPIESITRWQALDYAEGVIGFGRGKNHYVCGVPSPSNPVSVESWLNDIRYCLDAGVDGVDIRVRGHSEHLEWSPYGFEEGVRAAYLDRFGTDILTGPYDDARLRRLRGEAHTAFVRRAVALVRSRGKRVQLEISPGMEPPPEQLGMYNMHWDWETWLREGLADSVLLKEVVPGSFLFDRVVPICHAGGIDTYLSSFMAATLGNINAATLETSAAARGWRSALRRLVDSARDTGLTGFQVYEYAFVVKSFSDGSSQVVHPDFIPILTGRDSIVTDSNGAART